jgi:thiol-disulfide isomerase/thioredoxin
MAKKTRHQILMVILTLVGIQALAVVVYLAVERTRQDDERVPFQYEVVDGTLKLPQLELVRQDGRALGTSELLGRPVLLHFWATWCPPCRDELPGLLELRDQASGLSVVALSVDKNWRDVRAFFGGTIPGAVFRDPVGALQRHYDVTTLPDTYLLNHDGVARVRFRGARDWSSAEARDRVRSYLRGASGTNAPSRR